MIEIGNMPWVLKGHSTFVRNRILKRYTLDELKSEDTWYVEVIEGPEADFAGAHRNEIDAVYNYFSPSENDLSEIRNKYGNTDRRTVVIEMLKDLYEQAFRRAIAKIE